MICHLCGARLAESLQGRHNHMQLYHAVIAEPKRFRPKAQVVADWEARHAHYVIDGRVCLDECRCMKCFQAALDRLCLSSEAALNDCGTDLTIEHDVSSDFVSQCAGTNG